jgi:glutathione S-transferase
MSTSTLTNLRDYLYGTLTPANMLWLATELTERARKEENEQLRPYTMEEIDDMLDEAEAAFEAGEYLTQDEVFHHRKVAV